MCPSAMLDDNSLFMKRMIPIRAFLLAISLLCSFGVAAQIRAVDAESGLPVSYASVFDDATGKVVGITSSDGLLPSAAGSCSKISLQHINYEPAAMLVNAIADHTIKLTPREAYSVNEVTVNKDKSDYVRLKWYVRRYTMVNGVVSAVGETLYYGYYDEDSKKLKKHIQLSQKLLRNKSVFEGQKKMVKGLGGGLLPFSDCVKVSSAIKNFPKYKIGKRYHHYNGKKKLCTSFFRRDNKAQRLEFVCDSGYVDKPLNLWAFGLSVSDRYSTVSFNSVYGKPGLSTLQNATYSIRFTHNKTKTAIDMYVEAYVLGVDYDTKAGLKALEKQLAAKRKSGTKEPFVRPVGFPPFNKYVAEAMTHMTEVKE